MSKPLILAIDTSCDETAVAVTQGQLILSNVIASQAQLHQQYGGVFPTKAKKAHQENIEPAVKEALKRAGKDWQDIVAIAVTRGPGLAPALEIGLAYAKKLANQHQKPIIPINHIEGHILSVLAQPQPRTKKAELIEPQLPALAVVVSGGHTEFDLVKKIGNYERLGMTVDDAAGECLDKVGRLLGLGYPAAPVVEKLAKQGNANRFDFPLPMTETKTFDMSFSGLKTHSKRLVKKLESSDQLDKQAIADFCASLQEGVFAHIVYKLEKLLTEISVKELWLGGGVAANIKLRKKLKKVAKTNNLTLRTPYTNKLCGDNAAMIGIVAGYILEKNPDFKAKNLDRQPRWSIADLANQVFPEKNSVNNL
jgi:N6-L-threonylcarbamoyladenine synthase